MKMFVIGFLSSAVMWGVIIGYSMLYDYIVMKQADDDVDIKDYPEE